MNKKYSKEEFIRYSPKEGDKVMLINNPCNPTCLCQTNRVIKDLNDKYKKEIIKYGEVYTVKSIDYFGGGCPSTTVRLNELQVFEATEDTNIKIPAICFIKVNITFLKKASPCS